MNKAKILEHLDQVEQKVKRGEILIEKQEQRLEDLASGGHPTKIHEENLQALREIQETMKETRDIVREELANNTEREAR